MGFRTPLVLAFIATVSLGSVTSIPALAQPATGTGKSPIVIPADIQDAERAYRRGELADARQRIERYLAKEPKDARARFLRGLILIEQRQPDAAIAAFSELALEQPELPEPHNNLAVLYAARGEYDKARDALQSALLANPNDAIAHENLGDIYVRLAQRSYERAMTAGAGGRALRDKLTVARELARSSKPPAATGQPPAGGGGASSAPGPSPAASPSTPSPTTGATQ